MQFVNLDEYQHQAPYNHIKPSMREDLFAEFTDFAVSTYINLCLETRRRELNGMEVRLLNDSAKLALAVWKTRAN